MTDPLMTKVMAEVDKITSQLQRDAAERKDFAALHLLDAAFAYEDQMDPERMAILMMVRMRMSGHGKAAGQVAGNALARLAAVIGWMG